MISREWMFVIGYFCVGYINYGLYWNYWVRYTTYSGLKVLEMAAALASVFWPVYWLKLVVSEFLNVSVFLTSWVF